MDPPLPRQNNSVILPTSASIDEKAAMGRALANESSGDLYPRLRQENASFRASAMARQLGGKH